LLHERRIALGLLCGTSGGGFGFDVAAGLGLFAGMVEAEVGRRAEAGWCGNGGHR